jgi:hypothetical protein
MSDSQDYLDKVGDGLNVLECAVAGKLPDRIGLVAFAMLLCPDVPPGTTYPVHAEDEPDPEPFRVVDHLRAAAATGQLTAELRTFPRADDGSAELVTEWIIQRTHAKQYLRDIGFKPEDDSPLWHWISTPEEKSKRAQTKAKHQKIQERALEIWRDEQKRSAPLTPITGPNGMGAKLKQEFPRSGKNIQDIVRPVAPPEVSSRRGPPKKPA